MRSLLLLLTAPALAVGLSGAASPKPAGQWIVLSRNSLSEACSQHAKLAGEGLMTPTFAIDTCTAAIEEEAVTAKDRAVSHNNRGVVQLTMLGEAGSARADFEAAARLAPELGESYANRGAALVAEERFDEAVAEIEKGLAQGLAEPWKAYFNRALARENKGDIRGAYADYTKALELKPGWPLAQTQLARFAVRRR
jgi:Tfp pilus assembly protein PilF